jgi:hypothetical protein
MERRRSRPQRIYISLADREVIAAGVGHFRQPDLYACHTAPHTNTFVGVSARFEKKWRATHTSLPSKIWKKSLFEKHGIRKEKMGKEVHFISVSQTYRAYASLCRVLII